MDGAWVTQTRLKTRLLWAARLSAGALLSVSALIIGVGFGGRHWVENQVLPEVEVRLSRSLQRQVTLGPVRWLWPWQISLGATHIEHLAAIDRVDVGVDVWHWLRTRELALEAHLQRPQVLWQETPDRDWWDLNWFGDAEAGDLLNAIADVSWANGSLTVLPLSGERETVANVRGTLRLAEDLGFELRGNLDQGEITLEGDLDLETTTLDLTIQGQRLPAPLIPVAVPDLLLEPTAGVSDVDVALVWQPNTPLRISGSVQFRETTLPIVGLPLPLTNLRGTVQLRDRHVQVLQASGQLGVIPFSGLGDVNWGEVPLTTATGTVVPVGLDLMTAIPDASLPELAELFSVPQPFDIEGRIASELQIQGLPRELVIRGRFTSLDLAQVDQLNLNAYSGSFQIADSQLSLEQLTGSLIAAGEAAGTIQVQGTVPLANPQAAQFDFQLQNAATAPILTAYEHLDPPNAQLNAQGQWQLDDDSAVITATWQLEHALTQGSGNFRYVDQAISLSEASFTVLDGTVGLQAQISPPTASGREFQAQLDLQDLNVAAASPLEQSLLTGQLTVSGNNRDLLASQVVGDLSVATEHGDINAALTWNGVIASLNGTAFEQIQLQGQVPVDLATLSVGELDFRLQANAVALEPLLPATAPISGRVEATARLFGPLDNLQLEGTIALPNLVAAGLAFAPLRGNLDGTAATGLALNLTASEQPDVLALRLDAQGNPLSATLIQGETSARFERVDNLLLTRVEALPLALLNPFIPGGGVAGQLDSDFRLDLENLSARGSLLATNPSWNGRQLSELQGNFVYADQTLELSNTEFGLEDSRYRLSARLDGRSATPQLEARLSTETGDLASLRRFMLWQNWSDLASPLAVPDWGTALDVVITPLGWPQLPLYDQIAAFVEVWTANQQRLAQLEADPLPTLAELEGQFQADLRLSGALTNPRVEFDLTGTDWHVAAYSLETVTARGLLADDQLVLSELSGRNAEREGRVQGLVGLGADPSLAINIYLANVPIELAQPFVPAEMPNFRGNLNLEADFGGSLAVPMGSGQLNITDAVFRDEVIAAATAQFAIASDVATLDAQITTQPDTSPITLRGDIPFNGRGQYSLQLVDEGLRFVNFLSDSIVWEAGSGRLNLTLTGSQRAPNLEGTLVLQQGQLRLPVLPEPLTDITGEVYFSGRQLRTDNLEARYGDGTVAIRGALPLRLNGVTEPLEIQLAAVELSLPDLYQGFVEGEVLVTGSALQPLIGGELTVYEGTVSARSGRNGNGVLKLEGGWQPEFNDLALQLGPGVNVAAPPLLNFTAVGGLNLNGALNALRPNGVIELTGGRVNLGLTSFRLDRDRPNTATFTPEFGLDPLLDVRVISQVFEVSPVSQVPSIRDLGIPLRPYFGGQQSIDVQATIQGRASALSLEDRSIVQLSSSPPRTETEIVALVSGSTLGGLATGDLAGFALSALFNNLQDNLGDALGLDELRFSAFSTGAEGLQIGVEAAKDLGAGVSISVQQSLTNETIPTRIGLRYRINENWQIRANTNFSGEDLIYLQYETRF